MGEDSSPDPYEVYERRVAAFTAAASFLVSRGDDTDDPFHTHINATVRAFARQSFLDADRAAGEGGPSWVGYVYPPGFPANADSVRPRELDMLKLVVELLRLHRPAARATPAAPAVEVDIQWDVRDGSQKDVTMRLGYKGNYFSRATEARADGEILLEPVPRGKGRPRWNMLILNREKYPAPGVSRFSSDD